MPAAACNRAETMPEGKWTPSLMAMAFLKPLLSSRVGTKTDVAIHMALSNQSVVGGCGNLIHGLAGSKRPGHIRDGKTFLDRKNLTAALDASLKRLQTD